MNNTITAAFVQEFHDAFVLAAQQTDSRLGATTMSRGMIKGSAFTANDMGTIDPRQVTNRYGDTEWTIPDVGVRQALMTDYDVAVPIDAFDLPKLLANPQGDYMKNALAGMNRKKDDVIYDALLGSALRKTSDTASYAGVALPSTQIILNGGTGFTKAKVTLARKLFRKREADKHAGEELFMLYDAEMLEDILADTTLTSADFMAVKMLQEGDVSGSWMGFKWVPYEAMNDTGTVRTTCAYTKSALHHGTGEDIRTDVGPRRDKRNLTQIYAAMSVGAVRVNESKVVQIDFAY